MIILCTESLKGYGLNRIFELVKKAGYDGIDLSASFTDFDTWNPEYIKKLVAEYNLPVHAISAPQHVPTKKIVEIVEMAKALGSKVVVLQPPRLLDFKMSSWLKKEIPKLREKEFISIAMENAPAGTFLGIIPEHSMDSTQELKDFKHVCLDTARIGEKRQDLMRAYAALKKFLVHIHLSNFYHGKKYGPPQEGILPLESFLSKLKQDKYPGALSIKVLPKFLHVGEDDEKVVNDLQGIKNYYEKFYANLQVTETPEEPTDSER